jgi:hypothetical protein
MSAHSRLAPSAADRWVECPASVQLSEQFPALLEHPSAPEGTAAHWVASSMLTTHAPAVGDIAPNGIAVTQEMIDGALLYYNHVFKLANPHGGIKARFRWEEREHMPSIHPECHGTPDGAGVLDFCDLTGEIHIPDYKFGHLEVSPETMQLKLYARGVLDRLGFNGHDEQFIKVHLHIIQPRCYTAAGPIRTYSTTAADLRADWNRLRAAAHEALGDKPSFKVGDQCKYCPGRRACPTLKRHVAGIMDQAEWSPAVELPASEIGLELFFAERSMALLESRLSGLREQVEANLRAGRSVEGWCMQSGQSSVRWSADLDELLFMADSLGVPLMQKDPNGKILPTPKQAAKLFEKAGIDGSVIDAYSETKPGGLKLVPSTQSIAVKAFGAK